MSRELEAKKVVLKAKKQVFSGVLGNNSSLFKGQGYDFVELREYQEGDDVKHIDWVITAKQHKPFVKVFHEEKQLGVVLIPLLSGSTFFGTKRLKTDLIAHIYAILSFSAIKNGDIYSKYLFTDRILSKAKPTKKHHQILEDVKEIMHFNPLSHTIDYEKLNTLSIKKKSLLFLMGDFVGDADLSLLAHKHDVVAVIVRDRFEEDPEELGHLATIDPVTNKAQEIDLSANLITQYKAALAENDRKLYRHFRQNRIRFVKIYTDEDPFVKLMRL